MVLSKFFKARWERQSKVITIDDRTIREGEVKEVCKWSWTRMRSEKYIAGCIKGNIEMRKVE